MPPYGYSTYVVTETDEFQPPIRYPGDPRLEEPDCFVLENEHIKVVLDTMNCAVVSLLDKDTGAELVTPQRPAGIFRLIQEDPRYGMTSWRVGRYMTIEALTADVHVLGFQKGGLRQSVTYRIKFNDSQLDVTVSLDKGSRSLNYDVRCDWQERGRPGENIPQLNFYAPVSYQCAAYRYDVPFGIIDRKPIDMDVPGNSFIAGIRGCCQQSLMLVTDSKYGYRGFDNALAVSLIRGSDPDRYPDIGFHHFRLALCAAPAAASKQELIQQA